jgi:cell division protein FtsL
MSPARRAFLPLWTLAIVATVSAFVVHLTLRGKTVQLGYELGRERQEEGNLREIKRVLELEAASYKTPERVEFVARTLLGMTPPPSEHIVALEGAHTQGDHVTAEHKRLVATGLEVPPP